MRSPRTSTSGRGCAARTGRACRSAAARRRSASRGSRWGAPVPELPDLCAAAVEAAEDAEQVEAFGEERTTTEVQAHRGEVEGLSFSESRGVGVRVIVDGRLGFAYSADPSLDEARTTVARARENAALATPDEHNVLPATEPIEPMDGLFFESLAALTTADKVPIALDMERIATPRGPRGIKTDSVQYGDTVGRVAVG